MARGVGAAVMRGCALAIALLVSTAAAAQFGREVAPAAAQGFVGHMSVLPEHGPVGATVHVSAEGLPPNTDFQLVWRTVRGSWKVVGAEYHGREYQPVAYQIATVRSDGAGNV